MKEWEREVGGREGGREKGGQSSVAPSCLVQGCLDIHGCCQSFQTGLNFLAPYQPPIYRPHQTEVYSPTQQLYSVSVTGCPVPQGQLPIHPPSMPVGRVM